MSTDALKRLQEQLENRHHYPVDKWDPPFCGEIPIRIDSDGRWWYRGNAIDRPEMVRLFSAILKKEGEDYMLVTPVEKVRIQVEDVPFVFTRHRLVEESGKPWLALETEVGEAVIVSEDHPPELRKRKQDGVLLPYFHVRNGLYGVPGRALYYRLIEEMATCREEADGRQVWGLTSGGVFYPLEQTPGA